MTDRLHSARILGAVVLCAGVAQLLASVVLGLARVDALEAAASEGATFYIIGTFVTAIGLGAVWMLRHRPLVAVLALLVWQGAVFWPLYRRTSMLGLAFHGEYILHHFIALLAAGVCVLVPLSWAKATELGRARVIPLAFAAVGSLLLLLSHLVSLPSFAPEYPAAIDQIATVALLVTPIAALALFWTRTHPLRLRVVFVAILVPLVMRVVLAGPEGLTGGTVPEQGRATLVVTMMIAAVLTFVLLRPRNDRWLGILVTVIAALSTAMLYVLYDRGFGEVEDGIGGLTESLLGFALPYPRYVARWELVLVSLALFAIQNAVYAALISSDSRSRGVALGLIVITGVGFTTPQLVLMAGAGYVLLLSTLVGASPETARRHIAPTEEVEVILRAVAQQLGLPGPVVLEQASGTVLALRGELGDTPLDLRARALRGGGWEVSARVGVVGRGRATLELIPAEGTSGQRPPHELGGTHRLRGEPRDLERLGDRPLDALVPFATAHIRLWEAGADLSLGHDLSGMSVETLTELIIALAGR